jgi:hypothetical protein
LGLVLLLLLVLLLAFFGGSLWTRGMALRRRTQSAIAQRLISGITSRGASFTARRRRRRCWPSGSDALRRSSII